MKLRNTYIVEIIDFKGHIFRRNQYPTGHVGWELLKNGEWQHNLGIFTKDQLDAEYDNM